MIYNLFMVPLNLSLYFFLFRKFIRIKYSRKFNRLLENYSDFFSYGNTASKFLTEKIRHKTHSRKRVFFIIIHCKTYFNQIKQLKQSKLLDLDNPTSNLNNN